MCKPNCNYFVECCLPVCLPVRQTAAWLSNSPGEEAALGLNLRGLGTGKVWANKMAWCSSQWMLTTCAHELHFNFACAWPQTLGSHPTCTAVCEWYSESKSQAKTKFSLSDVFLQKIQNCDWNVTKTVNNIIIVNSDDINSKHTLRRACYYVMAWWTIKL